MQKKRQRRAPEVRHRLLKKRILRPKSRSPRSKPVPKNQNLFCAFLEYSGIKASRISAKGEPTIPSDKMAVSTSLIYDWCRGNWRRPQQAVLDKMATWFAVNHGVIVHSIELEQLVTTNCPLDPAARRAKVERWLGGLRKATAINAMVEKVEDLAPTIQSDPSNPT